MAGDATLETMFKASLLLTAEYPRWSDFRAIVSKCACPCSVCARTETSVPLRVCASVSCFYSVLLVLCQKQDTRRCAYVEVGVFIYKYAVVAKKCTGS